MTTTIKLNLANTEVHRIFTRTLPSQKLFFASVMQKIFILYSKVNEGKLYALLLLKSIQNSIQNLTQDYYDEIDKLEGILEKKSYLKDKSLTFETKFQIELNFDTSISADLVELFSIYDRLISLLKALRSSSSFANDNDYYSNLRRYFKLINCLLSQIQLTKSKDLPILSFDDVIDENERYHEFKELNCTNEYSLLHEAITSNLAPRIKDKIRTPLLINLQKLITPAQDVRCQTAQNPL